MDEETKVTQEEQLLIPDEPSSPLDAQLGPDTTPETTPEPTPESENEVAQYLKENTHTFDEDKRVELSPAEMEDGNKMQDYFNEKKAKFSIKDVSFSKETGTSRSKLNDMHVLVNTEKITITDEEKDLFIKSLLCDTPFTLPISLYKDQLIVVCRTKGAREDDLITYATQKRLREMRKDDTLEVPELILASMLQELRMVIQIEAVNGKPFATENFNDVTWDGIDEASDKLLKLQTNTFKGIEHHTWMMLCLAVDIFNSKLAKLQEGALDQNF